MLNKSLKNRCFTTRVDENQIPIMNPKSTKMMINNAISGVIICKSCSKIVTMPKCYVELKFKDY